MSVFLRSLSVLEENVRQAVKAARSATTDIDERPSTARHAIRAHLDELCDQLAADCREVRADVGALMERNGEGW